MLRASVSVSEILSGDIRKSLLMSLQTEEVHIHTGKEEEKKKKADRHAPQRERERQTKSNSGVSWVAC